MIATYNDMPAKILSRAAPPAAPTKKGPMSPLPNKSFCRQPLVPVVDVPVDYDIKHKGIKTTNLEVFTSALTLSLTLTISTQEHCTGGSFLGGGNGPPRKHKKGTINEVPSRRG